MPRFEKKPMAGGIGDSKVFAAPEGTFEPPKTAVVDGEERPGLPLHYGDDAIAERAARPKAYTEPVADAFDKRVAERRDSIMEGIPAYKAPDPRMDVVRDHVKPGQHARLLSPEKCSVEGNRGYTPVLDRHGREVTVGKMVLATLPEHEIQRRRRYAETRSNERVGAIREQFLEQSEKAFRDAGVRPPSSLGRPSAEDQGLQPERLGEID